MSAHLRPLTLDEFLDWERAQEERYEFDGVQPVAMTGGSRDHARVVLRLASALAARVRPGCEAFPDNLKVLAAGRARYPDVTVACGPQDALPRDTVEPTVVVEVLSPSTALTDRRVKAFEYMQHPAVEVVVLLAQDAPEATVWRRSEGWRRTELEGRDAVLALPEVGAEVPLSGIYLLPPVA